MTLGGRRVKVRRPRARSADDEPELPVRTYEYFADPDPKLGARGLVIAVEENEERWRACRSGADRPVSGRTVVARRRRPGFTRSQTNSTVRRRRGRRATTIWPKFGSCRRWRRYMG